MELKYDKVAKRGFIFFSSNRTFMELKLLLPVVVLHRKKCSNRTFMELKSLPFLRC